MNIFMYITNMHINLTIIEKLIVYYVVKMICDIVRQMVLN